jgi:hypothetical protein
VGVKGGGGMGQTQDSCVCGVATLSLWLEQTASTQAEEGGPPADGGGRCGQQRQLRLTRGATGAAVAGGVAFESCSNYQHHNKKAMEMIE